MMTMCLIFREEMIQVMCVYAPQSEKPDIQKDKFYDELIYEWDMKGTKKLTLGIGDFNGHVGKKVDEFESVHGGNGIGEQNLENRMMLEFCNQKDLCVANTWFKKRKGR